MHLHDSKFLASKCRYYFAAEAFSICAKYGFREDAMAVATNCGAYKAAEAFKTAIDHGMWEEAMVLSLKSVVDEAIDMFMTAATLYKGVTNLDQSGCGDSKVLLALKLAIEAGLDREAELLAERCNGQDAVAALEFAADRGLHKVMELLIARCYSDNVLAAFMVVATRGLSNEAVMLAQTCTVSSVCEMFDIAMKHRLYEAVKILGITRNTLNVEASGVRSVKVSKAHIRNKYATRSKRKLPLNTQTPQ